MRTLLCIHRRAGAGHDEGVASRMATYLEGLLRGQHEVSWSLADDHAEVARLAREFVLANEGPVLVLGGGGSGTARAVIEGVLAADASAGRARVAFLRLGSGNLLARQYGVPKEVTAALDGIAANVLLGATAPCTVMRCEMTDLEGVTSIRHAASLIGLGELGRIPADLKAIKARRWHAALGRMVGIENRTRIDYLAFSVRRLAGAMLHTARFSSTRIEVNGRRRRMRLLAGAVMNFPVAEMPLPASVTVEEPRLTVHLLPRPRGRLSELLRLVRGGLGRLVQTEHIEAWQTLSLQFAGAHGGTVFLDEDTLPRLRTFAVRPVQGLRVVPGPGYRFERKEQ